MFSSRPLTRPLRHFYQGQFIDPQVTVTTPSQFGNGFFVAEWRDAVVTCAHVVRSANTVRIRARAEHGGEVWFDGQTAVWDDDRDLAIVRLPFRVAGFHRRIGVRAPWPGGETSTSLVGYGSPEAWVRGQITREPPVRGHAADGWIEYREGSPGGHGFSGSAVFDVESSLIVGAHSGSPGAIPNRAARVDMASINALRNFAHADERF